ncbi:MAG: hypothetical protein QW057_05920 [Candidatus Bathyarchaeia archaeon]
MAGMEKPTLFIDGSAAGIVAGITARQHYEQARITVIEMLGGQVCCGPTSGEVANISAAMIQKRMAMGEVASFQMGTHPALRGSPIAYQVANAAEDEVRRSSEAY